MTIPLESIPSFTGAEALAVAVREFGVGGTVAALPSERDQNFLISVEGGGRLVLKFANLHDAPELLDFQNLAMRHVGWRRRSAACSGCCARSMDRHRARPQCQNAHRALRAVADLDRRRGSGENCIAGRGVVRVHRRRIGES